MNNPVQNKFNVELINEGRLKVSANETLLDASLKAGIDHNHACGSQAKCSTCRVLVREGAENLSPLTPEESDLALRQKFPPEIRLACQAKVTGGPIRVHRLVRDKLDLELMCCQEAVSSAKSLGCEKELALFFLDIREFTPFAESQLPFDVIHILNRFHRMVQKTIEENNGSVVEVAGDGLYSAFGLECPMCNAVADGVQAGHAVLKNLEKFNDDYLQPYFNHRLRVGIGIHTGKVIYGQLGIGVGGATSVIGYPVNLAARVEAATKTLNNDFLITEAAYEKIPAPRPKTTGKKSVKLKGVTDPVTVHLLGNPYDQELLNEREGGKTQHPVYSR